MGKQVGAIGFALYKGLLDRYMKQERRYDSDLLLTYGPDADLSQLASFAEQLRSGGYTVRCEQESRQSSPVRCRRTIRYQDGIRPEEVEL